MPHFQPIHSNSHPYVRNRRILLPTLYRDYRLCGGMSVVSTSYVCLLLVHVSSLVRTGVTPICYYNNWGWISLLSWQTQQRSKLIGINPGDGLQDLNLLNIESQSWPRYWDLQMQRNAKSRRRILDVSFTTLSVTTCLSN